MAWMRAIKVFVKSKEVKPKIPESISYKFSQVSYINNSKLKKSIYTQIAKSFRHYWPKAKAKLKVQTKVLAKTVALHHVVKGV